MWTVNQKLEFPACGEAVAGFIRRPLVKVKEKVLVTLSRSTLCDPTDCGPQAPLSMGFSRQECWSG